MKKEEKKEKKEPSRIDNNDDGPRAFLSLGLDLERVGGFHFKEKRAQLGGFGFGFVCTLSLSRVWREARD